MTRLAWLLPVALAGCAGFSDDARFGPVEQAVKERTGAQTQWVRSASEADTVRGRVRELLGQPLTPESAVQIALLNNPGLQAGYAEVGIAEAELVQAERDIRRSIRGMNIKQDAEENAIAFLTSWLELAGFSEIEIIPHA